MSGSVFISIPLWPPSDADDLYARTHGKVDFADDSDTPMVKVHVFDSDRVLVRGLDGMYAGQSIELLIGGDAGYYIDITPLKASTHELRITAGWDIPKDRLVTIRAGSKTRLLERGRYTTVTGQAVRLNTEKKTTWLDKLANW